MLSRLLRIFNVSVALAVVLIAIAVYWFAYRPLPQTSGEIEAPIGAPATIARDARGVPHIEAASWQDATFLQGYVTAQDRLWQMDVLRRFGAGELAEVFGPQALVPDERSRKMRMRAIAETAVGRLEPKDRTSMVEYARGVNYFIDTHRGNYSLEFSLPGHAYDPRPWTVVDSILIELVMFRDMTDNSKFEFDKGTLLAQADPVKVRTLFPPVQGEQISPGSNAWAVSGMHTTNGKPMVANDPHLAYGIPGTWYLAHLKASDLDVSGATLPGLPGVVTGHNKQIAWGLTNLETDVMDLYIEQIDGSTGRYIFQGKAEQAQLDRQTIGVRGGKPVQIDTWVTRHGPILLQDKGKSYSLRWSATDGFDWPVYRLNRAGNWQEFRQALNGFWGPGMNFVYADKAGNIGYQGTGRMPIRADGKTATENDVPLEGAAGTAEWTGYIPFDQMPSVYNPPSGLIATANQNPYPSDFAYQMNGGYADRYRVEQIRSRLAAKSKLGVEDMLAIQKDVYSAYDSFLARQVASAFAKRASDDEFVREAVEVLKKWDGQMDKDKPASVITQLLSNTLQRELVGYLVKPATNAAVQEKLKSQPQDAVTKSGERARSVLLSSPAVPDILPRSQIVEKTLRKRPAGWVPNDDWDEWLRQSLKSALDEGRRRQGSPVASWRWGRMMQWNIAHAIGKNLPLVSGLFDIGPVEMSGSGTTVKQTSSTLGPSERMVVDLGDLDRSVQNLPVGESGFVASKHYKDQWPAYYVGKSFPMEFDRVNAKEVLKVRPQR